MSTGVAGLLGLTFLLSIIVQEVPRAPKLPLLGKLTQTWKNNLYQVNGLSVKCHFASLLSRLTPSDCILTSSAKGKNTLIFLKFNLKEQILAETTRYCHMGQVFVLYCCLLRQPLVYCNCSCRERAKTPAQSLRHNVNKVSFWEFCTRWQKIKDVRKVIFVDATVPADSEWWLPKWLVRADCE